ncbi:MAG TPA: hypothetical protein PKD55_01390 [Bellilinea sp.]|nr:hypothetical protein [Bellilinea sp.]
MKQIKDYSQFLRKHGINPLTGEACGLSMRILCDVTEEGKALLENALGVQGLNMWEGWNGAPYSVMLFREMFPLLVIFAAIMDGAKAVIYVPYQKKDIYEVLEGIFVYEGDIHSDEWKDITTNMRELYNFRVIFPSGDSRGGTRNYHHFSGRTE